MVPEANDAVALALEPFRSTLVMAQLVIEAVMGTVHLNDQLQPVGDEIREVNAYRRLPAKMSAFYWNAPQMPPQDAFLVGHRRAKPLRRLQLESIEFWHGTSRCHPHPPLR